MSLHRSSVVCVAIILGLVGSGQARAQDSTKKEVVTDQLQSAASVREKIRSSGMTPDQVRGRLRQRGLSESLLDAYMGSAAGGQGAAELAPGRDVLAAVAVLGEAEQREFDAATRSAIRTDSVKQPITINGLEVFGMRIFQRGSNQFEPNLAGAVDPNYRLGATDVVTIIATGQVELSHSLEVTRNGYIIIPQVGQVFVANLTLADAERLITQQMRRAYTGAGTSLNASTRISVNVARLRSNQIFVIGDVVAPGSYVVSAAGTALSALYAAGGPTLNGSMRRVEVRRANVVVSTFDMYDYLIRGDASKDVRLENGDVIFVPANPKRVAITGEITRPALYELKEGETLADLVVAAGGLTPTSARRRLEISRILPPSERGPGGRDRVVIDVQGPELLAGSAPPTPLLSGDRVAVFGIAPTVRDVITITGNVWAPGALGFRSGMTLSEALRRSGGIKHDTYLDEVQITRLQPDQRRTMLRVRLSDTLGAVAPDLALQDADSIHVFSAAEFRTTRQVRVAGKVRHPGPFEFRRGMTFRDLALLAGGVEEGTDVLDSVSVSRIQSDLTSRTFQIPLRDGSGAFSLFEVAAGDSFVVRSRSEFRPQRYVTIGGAVKIQSTIPYTEGLTLRQAVLAAGGLTEKAWLPEVEISRVPDSKADGKLATVFRVPLDSSYIFERGPDGKYLGPPGVPARVASAPEVPLLPYDHVNVLEQPEWSIPGTVTIGGEVRFPGAYAIVRQGERITDLIQRAGGLTNRAYPEGAVFRREVTPADSEARAHLLNRVELDRAYSLAVERVAASGRLPETGAIDARAAVSREETALQNTLRAGQSDRKDRIAIDLNEAMRRAEHQDNLALRAGDELVIPIMTPSVTIRGFVNAPVTLSYKPGASLEDYLAGAGGVTQNADVHGAFVQQPNGRIETYRRHFLRPDDVPIPQPGAVIVVPPKEVKVANGTNTWVLVLSAVGTFATSVAAIISLTR